MNSFYGNLATASETMQGSVDDAKKAQEQIAKLAGNLSNLNTVYGNMLSAMQGRTNPVIHILYPESKDSKTVLT